MADQSTATPVVIPPSTPTATAAPEKSKVAATALYTPNPQKSSLGSGSLASRFDPTGSGTVNIVDDYYWTLTPSRAREDVPTIQLKEYEINESMLKRQVLFYTTGFKSSFSAAVGDFGTLDVYDEIFPKTNNATGWKYYLPYFSEANFDLKTVDWTTLGSISDLAGGVTEAAQAKTPGSDPGKGWLEMLGKAGNLAVGAYNVGNAVTFPVVGINDRPRLFSSHATRTVDVMFPLFNTTHAGEWKRNRDFLYLFINQNLFNKRDFATGLPPVFYEVFVPGQYFSVASCVTNVQVKNRGNMREMTQGSGRVAVVPDVYEVHISLTELAMPSKNQFQAIEDGQANSRIQARVKDNLFDAPTRSDTPTA